MNHIPAKAPFRNSFYALSKLAAENYLLSNKGNMEVVILNPGFMLGPYDSKPSSGKIILMGWKKKVVFYPPGGKSFVHVQDVASGILKAMLNGHDGEKYLLVNENLSFREFYLKLNNITHHNPVMIGIPEKILLLIGYAGDLIRKSGIKTNICSLNMKMLCIDNFYLNSKSIRELGVVYSPVDKAIQDAIDYFNRKFPSW